MTGPFKSGHFLAFIAAVSLPNRIALKASEPVLPTSPSSVLKSIMTNFPSADQMFMYLFSIESFEYQITISKVGNTDLKIRMKMMRFMSIPKAEHTYSNFSRSV